MRALIFSDSHGAVSSMANIIDREENIDLIIHAGDVNNDCTELQRLYPNKSIVFVRGNNDYFDTEVPFERLFDFGGIKIFLTHGHKYGVKTNVFRLFAAAREKGADLCIFGHTHCRFKEESEGIWLFNPGSAQSSCGLLEVSDGNINLEFLY